MLAGFLFISYSLQGLALGVDKYTQCTAVQTEYLSKILYMSPKTYGASLLCDSRV